MNKQPSSEKRRSRHPLLDTRDFKVLFLGDGICWSWLGQLGWLGMPVFLLLGISCRNDTTWLSRPWQKVKWWCWQLTSVASIYHLHSNDSRFCYIRYQMIQMIYECDTCDQWYMNDNFFQWDLHRSILVRMQGPGALQCSGLRCAAEWIPAKGAKYTKVNPGKPRGDKFFGGKWKEKLGRVRFESRIK